MVHSDEQRCDESSCDRRGARGVGPHRDALSASTHKIEDDGALWQNRTPPIGQGLSCPRIP